MATDGVRAVAIGVCCSAGVGAAWFRCDCASALDVDSAATIMGTIANCENSAFVMHSPLTGTLPVYCVRLVMILLSRCIPVSAFHREFSALDRLLGDFSIPGMCGRW